MLKIVMAPLFISCFRILGHLGIHPAGRSFPKPPRPGPLFSHGVLFVALLVFLLPISAQNTESLFGKKESSGGALIGIIYDLKQDQKRRPTGISQEEYIATVAKFLDKNWDESVLNRYFRAARPLYATQIFIPMMRALEAPKAFDVANVMKAAAWVVHYKGQVSPPEDGVYRFICYADDMMAVGINGRTVCNGSRRDTPYPGWKSPEKEIAGKAANGELIYGDWIRMGKSDPIDLDIIVGERPGGGFCAFLMYQKQGTDYPKEGNRILFPIFKLASQDMPVYPEKDAPPFLRDNQLWKGHQ